VLLRELRPDAAYGRLDILVNNAGNKAQRFSPFELRRYARWIVST